MLSGSQASYFKLGKHRVSHTTHKATNTIVKREKKMARRSGGSSDLLVISFIIPADGTWEWCCNEPVMGTGEWYSVECVFLVAFLKCNAAILYNPQISHTSSPLPEIPQSGFHSFKASWFLLKKKKSLRKLYVGFITHSHLGIKNYWIFPQRVSVERGTYLHIHNLILLLLNSKKGSFCFLL